MRKDIGSHHMFRSSMPSATSNCTLGIVPLCLEKLADSHTFYFRVLTHLTYRASRPPGASPLHDSTPATVPSRRPVQSVLPSVSEDRLL